MKRFYFFMVLLLATPFSKSTAQQKIAVLRIEAYGPKADPLLVAQFFRDAVAHTGRTVIPKPEMTETLQRNGMRSVHFAFNIPVNIYAVPNSLGWRFGLSIGFNLRTTRMDMDIP